MTTEEINNLTDSLTEEYERYKDDLTIKGYIKRVIEITNLYWQEKTRWIPVDERLPKLHPITPLYWISGYVLTLNNAGGYSIARLCKYADEEGKWAGVDCFERLSITHWKEIE